MNNQINNINKNKNATNFTNEKIEQRKIVKKKLSNALKANIARRKNSNKN